MKERLRVGVVGLGLRGMGILENTLLPMADVDIVGVCDLYEDRVEKGAALVEKERGVRPFETGDYHEILKLSIDAVIIEAAWEAHVPVMLAAMKAGIYVGSEVAGAYSVEDCWRLVHTYEETGTPCMLLENCCYGKRELMMLNMVEKGFFGDVMYCEGGYHHDLREEVTTGAERRHYRLRNYLGRNGENYPTHELVPIGKLLRINDGNRMVRLTSMASASKGMQQYVRDHRPDTDALAGRNFNQGDVVSTTILCANGELINITLDTSLPTFYHRGLVVRGTRASYSEWNDSVREDGMEADEFARVWDNLKDYKEKYQHPLWRDYQPVGGHDGMDELVYRAFVECAKAGIEPPIDVYDAATYMAITALSEESIALGGAPVYIPDFTNGRWLQREPRPEHRYSLHKIVEGD